MKSTKIWVLNISEVLKILAHCIAVGTYFEYTF